MLGARSDDRTSYHRRYDFQGKIRADRPDCLFYLKEPDFHRHDRPPPKLVWNGKVVLDYRGEPILDYAIPLTISSKIGKEPARLEAMLRSNKKIHWNDILARIIRRGATKKTISQLQNSLNVSVVRFRIEARLISFGPRLGSKALENHLLSSMTAEMVVKNTTRGLADLVHWSGEKSFIETLNLNKKSQAQDDQGSRKENIKTPKGKLNEKRRRSDLERKIRQADAWAQAQMGREAQTPIPTRSVFGEMNCTAIESIVAFKLASMDQYQRNGSLVFKGWCTLDHAAPVYPFNHPRMEEFFGSPEYYGDNSFLLQNDKDPYGLLGSQIFNEAHKCLIEFLLEPARLQYRAFTLANNGSQAYKPIFLSNPIHSYWQQLQRLQRAFEQDWAELGHEVPPPVLSGLLKLDYQSMTWNTSEVPVLALVLQTIDSCNRTFAIWQRQQAEGQRAKLCELQHELEETEEEVGGSEDDAGRNNSSIEETEEEGGEVDVDMEETEEEGSEDDDMEGGADSEDVMEVDREEL